jgi:hypothetical protein
VDNPAAIELTRDSESAKMPVFSEGYGRNDAARRWSRDVLDIAHALQAF